MSKKTRDRLAGLQRTLPSTPQSEAEEKRLRALLRDAHETMAAMREVLQEARDIKAELQALIGRSERVARGILQPIADDLGVRIDAMAGEVQRKLHDAAAQVTAKILEGVLLVDDEGEIVDQGRSGRVIRRAYETGHGVSDKTTPVPDPVALRNAARQQAAEEKQ